MFQAEIETLQTLRLSDSLPQSYRHSQRKRRNFYAYILTSMLSTSRVLNSWEELRIYIYVASMQIHAFIKFCVC